MVFAHIFGIPVEETALGYAPVVVTVVAGVRLYVHHAHRKLPSKRKQSKETAAHITAPRRLSRRELRQAP
jgi:hypothetical protein